jgi:polysaccharide export outer membrane protein
MMTRSWQALCLQAGLAAVVVAVVTASPAAQAGAPGSGPASAAQPPLVVPAGPSQAADLPPVPADYVIGAEDVLNITSRFHEDLSGDWVVRPDGKVALPLLKDVVAAGLTIEEFRAKITAAITPFLKGDPVFTVQPKQINSRKVYITGEVNKPGPFPLLGPMTVLQLLSNAGGLTVYAKQKDILIIRPGENGSQVSIRFNYEDVRQGRNLDQNILLKPGDQVVVP